MSKADTQMRLVEEYLAGASCLRAWENRFCLEAGCPLCPACAARVLDEAVKLHALHLWADLDMLREIEWSGSVEISTEDGDDDVRVPGCPSCDGLQELPETVTIGDKWQGYAEAEPHPDHEDDVGHRDDCKLDARIKALVARLA